MIDGGLRQLFRKHLPHFHFVSIETGGTGRGIPDSEYCVDGKTGWIEFKQTKTHRVVMQPEQIGFMLRRGRAGGRAFIAVRRKRSASSRRDACDELWLMRGDQVLRLASGGLTACSAETFEGGPARWDWGAVGRYLVS